MLSMLLSALLGTLGWAGCSSGSSGEGSVDGGPGSASQADASKNDSSKDDSSKDDPNPVAPPGTSPRCDLTLYPGDYDPACQTAMDDACCAEEQACADNAACKALIACINACAVPRQEECITECAGGSNTPPGFEQFEAIAACSKKPPSVAPASVACGYP